MNRDMFVKVATTVLRQRGVPSSEDLAEAIAQQMDVFAAVLGDIQPPPPVHPVPSPPQGPVAPFPSPNPAAIAPVVETEPEPAAVYTPNQTAGYAGPPLVTLETTIPDKIERPDPQARMAAPVRSVRKSATKMKVEDLNQLIQDRTPPTLSFDVPMSDGRLQRVTWARNVISRHNEECVQLIYAPPGVSMSVREAVEVTKVLNVDDIPFDLPTILQEMAAQAVESIRPKGAPREVPVRPFSGANQASAAYSDGLSAAPDGGALGQVGSIMTTSATDVPAGYVPPTIHSEYHPGQLVPPER